MYAAERSASGVAVGFFDSGIGGLSVASEFGKRRPEAEMLYVADWQWCPYGRLSVSKVADRARIISSELIKRGCRMIVVACNTATAAAIDMLRAEFEVPFVGMEPAVKPAALNTKTGVVGILATPCTLHGRLFMQTSARYGSGVKIISRDGVGFVDLVESGDCESEAAYHIVEKSVCPLVEAGADHIVLGCTHYPFLKGLIARAAGTGVTVVDPSAAVAEQAAKIYDSIVRAG